MSLLRRHANRQPASIRVRGVLDVGIEWTKL
jgi:hypothetical protein